MDENRSIQGDINSIACLDKKRKVQDELLEMPLPKHICQDQHLRRGLSSNFTTEPKKAESEEFGESDPESMNSNSFHFNSDSAMSTDDDAKTDREYPETCSSDKPSTSSAISAGTSSEISLYTSESTWTNSGSSEAESLSISEQHDCGLVEFGSHSDFNFSDYAKAGIEQCTDKELENLLYSNGVAPSTNYILSSGRWTINQDTQQEGKKLTIDKEFEQYFSMLML